MSTSAPALCALCPSWYVAEKQVVDRVSADTSGMVTSVDECQAKWQWFSGFWTGYLTVKGWKVLEASLQSTLASQEQNDKKWNEGRQAKSLSFEKFKFPRSLAILWRSRKAKVAPRPVKWPRAQILWEKVTWVYIRVHFWLEVVTLNPVNNQTGKRHFICVSMATNQDFHRTLVTVVYCHLLLYLLFLLFISCWPHFFCIWEKTGFFFLLMPSFTKAKTFAKCPSVYKDLLLFIFAFPMNNSCEHFFFTYFVMVAVGFQLLCICRLEFKYSVSCEKRNTRRKKKKIVNIFRTRLTNYFFSNLPFPSFFFIT